MQRLGLFIVVASALVGCNLPLASSPSSGGPDDGSAHASIPKEAQAEMRAKDQKKYAEDEEKEDERVDEIEKNALKAIRMSLGKQAWGPGQGAPEPSTLAVKKLRAAKIKVRLSPITNEDGKSIDDNFLQLSDSYSDRLTQLNRKIVEQRLTKAETKEIQQGSKHIMSVNDLRQPVMSLSSVALESNFHVTHLHLTQMLDVSMNLRTRKLMAMELDAADYEHFRKGLTRLKRIEAIAATTVAMLATYQAVLNDGGDAKALDVVAEGALKAFPIKVEASNEEAKAYVKNLSGNVAKVRGRYEAWMRKAVGDAKYDRSYKAQYDALFDMCENAQKQKSVFEMQRENMENAQAERSAARAKQAEPAPRSAPPPPPSDLSANGVDGALDAAGKMFPSDGQVGAALQGIAALRKGDAHGAINAALTFVPVPGLKDAFGVASKLLFNKG